MKSSLLALFFAAFLPTLATAGHPITPDDLFSMMRLSPPVLSPDGMKAAYSIKTYDLKGNTHSSHIFLTPLPNGAARQITRGEGSDFSPRWSNDGKTLYFLSTREGEANVYALSMRGGEARPVTHFENGVDDYILSPDGAALYLLLQVHPECGSDEACNENKRKVEKGEKSSAKIFTHLLYRHWDAWLPRTVSHVVRFNIADGAMKDLTPGSSSVPPIALNGPYALALSPDGTTLAYVTNHDRDLARSTNHDIYLVDVKSGQSRCATCENLAWDDAPRYSPDGIFLAYLSTDQPGYESDQADLILLNLKTMEKKNLTKHFDLGIGTYRFTPNGRTIIFIAEKRGHRELFSLSLRTGKIKELTKGRTLTGLALSPDSAWALTLDEHTTSPREIIRVSLGDGSVTPITRINQRKTKELEWGTLEEVTYPSTDGTKIHGFIVKPPHFDPAKRYPLILLVHGGPQGAWEDDFHYRWNLQMLAAPGYVVFAPNFRGSTGYGAAFKEAISGDWGGKPYQDIMSGVDYVVKSYPFIDANRMGAAGASYGGFMIDWIATQTDRFKCLVTHDGVYDQISMYGSTEELWFPEWEFKGDPYHHPELYRKFSPSTWIKNVKTPMLIVEGAHDFRVPLNQAMQLFTALQVLGVESRFLYFPDEDHFVQKYENAKVWWREVYNWFSSHLEGDPR